MKAKRLAPRARRFSVPSAEDAAVAQRHARAMEALDAGYSDWNPSTGEMFQSERVKEVLGFPPDARFADRADFMARVPLHPDDRRRVDDAIAATMAGEADRYELDYRVVLTSGETRWIRAHGKVLRDEAGRPVRMTEALMDVTARSAALEEVRLRKDELQRMMDSISDCLWSAQVAPDGSFAYRYYSPVVERITGRPAEYFLDAPRRWFDTIEAQDRPRVLEFFRRVISGAADRDDAEYRILRADGALRWVRDNVRATRAADGRIRLDGVMSDVTERKLAADALRESEARFRGLTELSSDWYWRQDEELRFTYLSGQALDLTGHTGESSIGKTRWELSHMMPLTCTWDEHKAVLAARQPFRDLECSRVGGDGVTRYLSMTGAPIFDEEGRFKGYHGTGRNITERKRIEAELRARQDMLDLAQKAASVVAFEWHIGVGAEHAGWSPDLEAMYGVAPAAHESSYDTWQGLVFAEDRAAVNAAIARARETGDVAVEYRVVHPNGGVRWLQLKGRVTLDDKDRPARMVGFMLDVTQRRQSEEELRRLELQLRQAQRLEAMGTLAGGIAHDFNNILGAILGYGERALRDAPKGSRLHRDLDSVMTAGERGRSLVEQILTFSRSSVSEQIPVHVERVVREALDHLAAKVPSGVTLLPQLHAGHAAVLGDPTQVHQVVMNLATNAFQAMPSGGTVCVLLEAMYVDAPRIITTGTVEVGEYVVLEVADTGVGIPPAIADRIFDPFFTTKEVGVGTGLGLSLVHGIVTDLGGAINVASARGAGSAFTIYLPRHGDSADASETSAPELPRGNRERVLVVDDEEALMRIATETLEDLGYRPTGFTSSVAALEAFRADPRAFDAVITDERMPGITGSALLREVRRMRPEIPTVLMSGFVGGAVASAAREAGADEVLKKPLAGRELVASLARVLRRARVGA